MAALEEKTGWDYAVQMDDMNTVTVLCNIFTAGVRTNGRVETENRGNKVFGGPKKSLLQLFTALNKRTEDQTTHNMICPLAMLRQYAGPFALSTCYKQMSLAMFYTADALQLPDGLATWHMLNTYENDNAYIGTGWLLRLVNDKGLVLKHLLKITHIRSGATHIIAIFEDGRYICDCCMGLNLGIVCCHYFLAWMKMVRLPFHISLIRAR
ncbi:hypothetical protein B0H17DRAFT_1163664 [Mycena rosella]|uniref:SWIM-type domain-containing protein n=1 Tax=Mycena rosella TaxID=1033263 RepID=A0AAD7CLW0_MYCRO|nr:hypothetical protein B0H17DRAFT_1163664 [Mycena rosella]